MTCRRGHEDEKQFIAGRMRCPECYRADNRARAARRRAQLKSGIPSGHSTRCPYCALVPCRCEEL